MKKAAQKKPVQKSGSNLKILIPLVVVFFVIGMLYWSSEQVDGDGPATTHQMADGVAKFYATFRKSFMPGDKQLDEYTIELPKPDVPLTQQLQQRGAEVSPEKVNWKGERKRRSFKENDTIKTAMQNFGKAEGVEVFWDLKYDYIIKHHFQEESNLKQLSEKIAKTVNGDFNGQVKSYFCPQEKALVITANKHQYVDEFCLTTTSKRRQVIDRLREKEYKLRQKLGTN